MNAVRHQSLLTGQSAIAQKVFQFVTSDAHKTSSVLDIASAMKASTGAGADIHIMRGCLAALMQAGLVREVVPGAYRQIVVKEKREMPAIKLPEPPAQVEACAAPVSHPAKAALEPMDALAAVAAQVRAKAAELNAIADDLDAQAIAIEERRAADSAKTAKAMQVVALLKELG